MHHIKIKFLFLWLYPSVEQGDMICSSTWILSLSPRCMDTVLLMIRSNLEPEYPTQLRMMAKTVANTYSLLHKVNHCKVPAFIDKSWPRGVNIDREEIIPSVLDIRPTPQEGGHPVHVSTGGICNDQGQGHSCVMICRLPKILILSFPSSAFR